MKKLESKRHKKVNFCRIRQYVILLLTLAFLISELFILVACGSKREETIADSTEEATTADETDIETEANGSEEDTASVSEENSDIISDQDMEESSGAEESESVLDDTTKAITVTEDESEEPTAEASQNGDTYTSPTTEAASVTTATTKKSAEVTTTTSAYTFEELNKTMYAYGVEKEKTDLNYEWAGQVLNQPDPNLENVVQLGRLTVEGEAVTVTGLCNETGWYRIKYNGSIGYVSSVYLYDTHYSSVLEKYYGTNMTVLTASERETLMYELADEVTRLVNEERAKENLPALKTDSSLTEAAMTRAKEIAASYSHDRPDGTSCFTALEEVGFLHLSAGENIAMGQKTPSDVMKDWMNSSGHRANIMDQPFVLDDSDDGYTYVNSYVDGFYGYDTIGVGVCYNNGFYWVQLFAQSHTHVWRETKNESGETIWECYNPYYSDPENGFYCADCFAWKDKNGVIYDEWD